MWRLWAKALGEKTGASNTEADRIALIRTLLITINVLTNFAIVLGIIRHW
jgi:hypothetical protein